MAKQAQKAKLNAHKALRRVHGRPKVDDPKVSTTLRFDPEMIAALDAWGKENGLGRSAAIRFAIAKLLKIDAAEKSS
jgi:uncharacterized protein (DUF4415 family)